MTNKIDTVLKAITDQIASTLPSDTVKNPKLSTYLVSSARSYPTEDPQCSTQTYGSINAITIHTEQQSASYDDGEKENKEEEDDPENIHTNPPTPPDPSVTFITEKALNSIHSSNHSDWIVDSLDGSNEIEYFNTFPAIEELEYHEWLLKYPKPSWVKAKIRTINLNNIKISCKMGHFLKRQAYIDLESLINVMSNQHYNEIMNKGLEWRHKPSNPSKNNNFVGRVKGLKVFIGNFTYECNFMILEDTTSIIDHHLGEVVFGKPFARNTGLIYDQEEGTVTFEKDDEKITFKMPHKMEASNHIDFKDINTDSIPPFVLGSNDNHGKIYYSDSPTLGPEYMEDESIIKEICT
ncbi:protein kinase-like domain, concanavalin A-like lectin/glucanase domain protein [Tanacetum coccineum]